MDVYSRPKYTELDPTLTLSIVFPLFFGLILGDVGYGLILLALCLGLRKVLKGEEGTQLLVVLRNASISSIIFGVLFGEFLGFPLPWRSLHIQPAPEYRCSYDRTWSANSRTDDSCNLDWSPAYHPWACFWDDQPCTPGSWVPPDKSSNGKLWLAPGYVGHHDDDLVDNPDAIYA